MSTTAYHHLRSFCTQNLNEFGKEFYLIDREIETSNFLNHLKQYYRSETAPDLIGSRKQSIEYWNRIFPTTSLVTTFNCRDIVPNVKQQTQVNLA